MRKITLFTTIIIVLISCGPKIYTTSNAVDLSKEHNILAILPPNVSIEARKKVDAESLKEQQKTESINFQREMYSWLLKRKQQGKITVDIQDVETTTAKLEKANYYLDQSLTPQEIADLLGVDAVLSSNYSLSKPMSQGASITLGLLVGYWGATNKTSIDLSLHDKNTGKMIWNFNHNAAGSFTSSKRLVDELMRIASKRMPYYSR